MEYHKHEGVYSNGILKSHPIDRQHSDATVQKHHNLSVGAKKAVKTQNTPLQKAKQEVIHNIKHDKENMVFCKVDNNGYVNINLDDVPNNVQGLRVKFTRTEGTVKHTVALQIEK